MVNCRVADSLCDSIRARKTLHPLRSVQCPVCQAHLRLHWGRLLFLGYLAVMALLAVFEFSNVIPRFHTLPAGVVLPSVFFFISSFYAFARRLPLESPGL